MPTPLRPIARRALAAQSDERLIRLVRDGHEPAFEEMVRRYRSPLVAFAAAIVSADGAEDVVQASLEKAHRALLADSREIALRPWLFAIVRNGALNAIRREPRVDELDEAMAVAAGPSEIAEQREDLDRLVVAMCALPEAQRQALVKRELEGVGHGEIAAQLGTTATAVRGLIFRARTGLRDVIGAVVPLPVVRALLTEGAAVGAAGGGASIALLGGAGAKGGTVLAAAVVALGTGIAIDHGRQDNDRRQTVAQASQNGEGASAGGSGSAAAAGATDASTASPSGGNASSSGDSEGDSGDSGDGGSGVGTAAAAVTGSGGGSSDGGAGGSEDSGSGGDDDSGGGGSSSGPGSGGTGGSGGHQQAPPPPPEDDDDHSGPGPSGSGGGGTGSGGGTAPPPEPEDDPSGSSGTGGHSGHGSETETELPEAPEAPEPPETESPESGGGHSGPGGGDD